MNAARQQAMESVEPVHIMQGEIIVRKGDVVRPEHIELLTDVGLIKTGRDYGVLAGMGLAVIAVSALMGVFLYQERRELLKNCVQLALIGSVLVAVLAIGKLFSMISWPGSAYLNPLLCWVCS